MKHRCGSSGLVGLDLDAAEARADIYRGRRTKNERRRVNVRPIHTPAPLFRYCFAKVAAEIQSFGACRIPITSTSCQIGPPASTPCKKFSHRFQPILYRLVATCLPKKKKHKTSAPEKLFPTSSLLPLSFRLSLP